jgi:hypothetical protein
MLSSPGGLGRREVLVPLSLRVWICQGLCFGNSNEFDRENASLHTTNIGSDTNKKWKAFT